MKRPRIHVELGRYARLNEALCVLDILVDKQIECPDWNVRRRQVRQIGGPSRRRVGRHIVSTTISAQVAAIPGEQKREGRAGSWWPELLRLSEYTREGEPVYWANAPLKEINL
jgi:hypothetical protein